MDTGFPILPPVPFQTLSPTSGKSIKEHDDKFELLSLLGMKKPLWILLPGGYARK